jgi:glutamyl-tRNA reductase
MDILCIGINHRTASLEIREKVWFSNEETRSALPRLKDQYARECVLVSTCNRTELYLVTKTERTNGRPLWSVLSSYKNADDFVNEQNFYSLSSLIAVKHLFNLVTGVDSMVLGDIQIQTQVKEAFSIAQEVKTSGIILNRLFNNALHVGKRARTETEISEGAVSISYAAAELASKIFADLTKRTALLIGAGETGKLTAKHLVGRNLGNLILANRTRQRAENLVQELGGTVINFDSIAVSLPQADIIISSIESPNYVLSASDIKQTMRLRHNKPLFIIDIGVPRNIDPDANQIDNVFLYDLDALNHIIDNNLSHRKAEVHKVNGIIFDELTQFKAWYDSLQVTPTIQELREQFESIRLSEIEKHRHHFPAEHREELEILTKRIINKILHTPMTNLKNGHGEEQPETTLNKLQLIRHLFGLDKGKGL